MKRLGMAACVTLIVGLTGCAGFTLSEGRTGLRVYDPALYIAVLNAGGGKYRTSSFVGPNLKSHYEIAPSSFLAKNDFSLQLSDGILKQADDELDTTALLDFLKQAATTAAGALGPGAGKAGFEATDGAPGGLPEGFYIWDGAKLEKITAP